MSNFTVIAQGWNEMAEANQRMIADLRAKTSLGRGIKATTVLAHRFAVDYTHEDTTALKHSHRIQFHQNGTGGPTGIVFVSPLRNPKTGLLTTAYAILEEDRGGDHAFYGLVIQNNIDDLTSEFDSVFFGGLR